MPSVADLVGLRERLVQARTSGVRELQDQNGERVVYRSDAELKSAIDAINRMIFEGERRPPSTILFRTSKGFLR